MFVLPHLLSVLIPGFALGPLIGVVGVLMLRNREAMLNTDKSQSSALIAPAGVAARGGGPQPGGKLPRPKGSDVLWGFLELRKGIFREKRDKVFVFVRHGHYVERNSIHSRQESDDAPQYIFKHLLCLAVVTVFLQPNFCFGR